jgi:hypothetical protein
LLFFLPKSEAEDGHKMLRLVRILKRGDEKI